MYVPKVLTDITRCDACLCNLLWLTSMASSLLTSLLVRKSTNCTRFTVVLSGKIYRRVWYIYFHCITHIVRAKTHVHISDTYGTCTYMCGCAASSLCRRISCIFLKHAVLTSPTHMYEYARLQIIKNGQKLSFKSLGGATACWCAWNNKSRKITFKLPLCFDPAVALSQYKFDDLHLYLHIYTYCRSWLLGLAPLAPH